MKTASALLEVKNAVEALQKKLKRAETIRGELTTALNLAKEELKEKDVAVADVNTEFLF